jgi:glycosyltransferase involved in cell wall biosynthesis
VDQRNCCVVIPTFNEQDSIYDLVSYFTFNSLYVIVVDDNSTDETRELATYAGAYVIHNKRAQRIQQSHFGKVSI